MKYVVLYTGVRDSMELIVLCMKQICGKILYGKKWLQSYYDKICWATILKIKCNCDGGFYNNICVHFYIFETEVVWGYQKPDLAPLWLAVSLNIWELTNLKSYKIKILNQLLSVPGFKIELHFKQLQRALTFYYKQ